MADLTLFQYCQKLVVFRDDTVLLARRQGEQDMTESLRSSVES